MNIYKINIPKSIIPLLIFAVTLNLLRSIIWKVDSFIYILWNIFLAFIPFIISFFILYFQKEKKLNKIIFIIGMILWILFIPNAPYIVTDFIHLGTTKSIPIIYDILLIFSSAVIGLILAMHSFFHIEQIIKMKYSIKVSSFIMAIIILLTSFGVYLGRFLRFNSWDLFVDHVSLVKNVWKIISDASFHIEVYLYTLLFFFFLLAFYKSWKNLNIK